MSDLQLDNSSFGHMNRFVLERLVIDEWILLLLCLRKKQAYTLHGVCIPCNCGCWWRLKATRRMLQSNLNGSIVFGAM